MSECKKPTGVDSPIWLSVTTVFRMLFACPSQGHDVVNLGLLPPPIERDAHFSGWPADEIAAILSELLNGATEDEIRHMVKKLMAARDTVSDFEEGKE